MTLYARGATYKGPRPGYKRTRFNRRRPFQGVSDRTYWAIMTFLGGFVVVAFVETYHFFVG
jgi:hypothetical protein